MSDIVNAAREVAASFNPVVLGHDAVIQAFSTFADQLEAAENSAPTYETLTPTSELLNKAARMINDLMIGRGVDRRNGFQWQAFVRELYDRAAAFKACEDEGKS